MSIAHGALDMWLVFMKPFISEGYIAKQIQERSFALSKLLPNTVKDFFIRFLHRMSLRQFGL